MEELTTRLLKQNADMIKQYQHEADEKHEVEKRKHKGLLNSFLNRR